MPDKVLPMIIKLSLLNTAAGLGTAKIFFRKLENIQDIRSAEAKDSHSFGAYKIKMLKNENTTNALPVSVRLYCILGYLERIEFSRKK